MATSIRDSWRVLLARSPGELGIASTPDAARDFGPQAKPLLGAIDALRETAWYEHVGESFQPAEQASRVPNWSEALRVQDDAERYVWGGTLIGPWMEMHGCDDEYPGRHAWWLAARRSITGAVDVITPRVEGLELERDLLLTDYIYDFLNLLMMEIVFSDVSQCTYFREQLGWFHAGHFPCGWDGDWPVGRMLVF